MKKPSKLDRFTGKGKLSLELVDDFAELSRAEQFEVLAILRPRTVEDTIDLPLFGIILPIIIGLSIGFTNVHPLTGPLWSTVIVSTVIGFVLAVVFGAVIGGPHIVREARRKEYITLLAAYEDELVRRRSMPGRDGRRWRATH